MGFICRNFGHKWKDCQCVRCGMTRSEGHAYHETENPCVQICSNCGSRKATHDWKNPGCIKICRVCGVSDGFPHRWKYQGGHVVCSVCGETKHKLVYTIQNCPVSELCCEICGKVGGTNDGTDYGCDFIKEPCLPKNGTKK